MAKKYIFFDIDGTLTDDNPGGKILDSTYRTLDKLRENGHFVAIATGRAEWMAREFAELSGIDNLVTDGGNGLTINGKVQYIKPLDFKEANRVIDECIENHFPYAVSIANDDKLYSNQHEIDGCPMHTEVIVDGTLDFHKVDAIYKIFIILTKEEENKLHLGKLDHMRYMADQLIIEPTEKYKGILEMVKLLGGNEEDIVVFGDGHNDYSMVKQAAIGIAMGNAIDELKEVATFVTKRNDDDGIEYACRHYGWI